MQISKELGCNYCTAWYMLHRIREGFVHETIKLSNIVESDTTYVGGKEANKHASKKLKQGRGTVGKTPVVGIKERQGKVKAKPVEYEDAKTLIDFVNETVTNGTTVYTNEAAAYARLAQILRGIKHETVKHEQGEYKRGTIHTNNIESVWAILKRSINGTWHRVSPKHLARYVDEITCRLNDGKCEGDTIDVMRPFVQQNEGKKLRYVDLIA